METKIRARIADELLVIEKIINEHAAISGHLHTVCSLMDSWDVGQSPIGGQMVRDQLLSQKGLNLRQTMNYLDEGIKQHHRLEEDRLPEIAGIPIMEALQVEHTEIIKQMSEIKFLLRDIEPEYLIENFDYLRLIVNNLCNLVSLHIAVENTLLNLLRKRFI